MNQLTRIIAFGIVAMLAALVVSRMRPTADASNRIHAAYNEAEQPVLRPGSGLAEVDQFAADLKRIDLDDATRDVKEAMAALMAAVETNAVVRRSGVDTSTANNQVADRKRDLLRALDRWRGQPY